MPDGASSSNQHKTIPKKEQIKTKREFETRDILADATYELLAKSTFEEDGIHETLQLAFKNIRNIERINIHWCDGEVRAISPWLFFTLNKNGRVMGRNFKYASASIGKAIDNESLACLLAAKGLTSKEGIYSKITKGMLSFPLGIYWNKRRGEVLIYDMDPDNHMVLRAGPDEFEAMRIMFEKASGVITPIMYKKEMRGLIEVCGSNIYFDGEKENADGLIRYAASLARVLGIHKRMQLDPLTQLFSKEMFGRDLINSMEGYLEKGKEFSLIYIDCDNFKKINDVYGHLAGDKVLRNIARRIIESTHSYKDRNYRDGGEEFATICSAPLDVAIQVAKRISSNVKKQMQIETTEDNETKDIEIKTTVSIGVADVRVIDMNAVGNVEEAARELKRIADEALYNAKEEPGKDSIFIAERIDDKIAYRKLPREEGS